MFEEVVLVSLTMAGIGITLSGGIAALAKWTESRQPIDSLVERVNGLLPQIQCAKCGFPGCRPYAEAVIAGERIDLCPPGGSDTVQALGHLLNRPVDVPAETMDSDQVAFIDENTCVGCARCIPACPVDAIVGAERYTHTILQEHCTGCELCIPVCPVDCIDLHKRTVHA